MVINLTEGDRGSIVARYSHAPIRVGFTPKQGSVANRFNLLTHLVKKPPTPRHAVELNLDAVRRIGIFPETSERDLHFAIPAEAQQQVQERLRAAGIAERPFLHIHPTSRWLFKAWPERNVSTLIDQLHARGWPVVITAAPDAREREFVQRVLSGVRQPVALDLSGQLTLKELGAVIDRSTCVVTLDSVPAHMASALKKPSVIIFGPSSEIEWGPWRNPNAKVVTQPMSCRPCGLDGCGGSKVSDCLVSLPVQSVLTAVLELYAQATIPKSMS
jgi:heptosyltransferase-3